MMHGAKDVEIDTISAFNDEYEDSTIPRFSAEVGRDEAKTEKRRIKYMIIVCVLLTLSSVTLMMYDGPRTYLRDKGNDMKEAHYPGALSNFRDYASLNPYGSKLESNKTMNEEQSSENGFHKNTTMLHPEAPYHFFEDETSFTYDDIIGYHEENDNDILDNETIDQQDEEDNDRTRSEQNEDFLNAGGDVSSESDISDEPGEGEDNSQEVDNSDFASVTDDNVKTNSTIVDNENDIDSGEVLLETESSSTTSNDSEEAKLVNNGDSDRGEGEEAVNDKNEIPSSNENRTIVDNENGIDSGEVLLESQSSSTTSNDSEETKLVNNGNSDRGESGEAVYDKNEMPSSGDITNEIGGDSEGLTHAKNAKEVENEYVLKNKDNDLVGEGSKDTEGLKTETENKDFFKDKNDFPSAGDISTNGGENLEDLESESSNKIHADFEALTDENEVPHSSDFPSGGDEDTGKLNNKDNDIGDEETEDKKETFVFEDSSFVDDDPIQDEEYYAEIVNNADNTDLSNKESGSSEVDVEGQQGEDKSEYEIISNSNNEDSTADTNDFIESDSGLDNAEGNEISEKDSSNEYETSENASEVKIADNNEGYSDKTDSYDDYDGDDDTNDLYESVEGSDTEYLFGPSDNTVVSGESGESKYPEFVVHHKVDPLYPDKNTEEGSSSHDQNSVSKGKDKSKHEAKDQLHNDKYSSPTTSNNGLEQGHHTSVDSGYSTPEILNGISPNQMDENKFGDVNQSYDSGHDVPFLWYIPRSAATSLENMLTRCHGMVLAGTKGSTSGAAEEKTLRVFEAFPNEKYLNVNLATPEGIERAARLGVVETGVVGAVFASRLHQVSDIFHPPDNQGRCFTIMRHPVKRAVSLFYYLRQAATEKSYDDGFKFMTIDEYAKSNKAESDWMTRSLTQKLSAPGLRDEDLEEAKEFLRSKCLIGLVDKFDESKKRFEHYFGWEKGDFQCENEIMKDHFQHKLQYRDVKEGSPTFTALAARNKYDMKLYEYAVELFEEQRSIQKS